MTSLFFPFESPGRQTIDWDLLGYVVLCVCLRACVWVCVCLYLPPLDPEMYPGSITASVVSRRLIALRTAPIRDRRCVTEPLSFRPGKSQEKFAATNHNSSPIEVYCLSGPFPISFPVFFLVFFLNRIREDSMAIGCERLAPGRNLSVDVATASA